ncbi:MAG: hypothetical protein RL545_413, partial [Actinomycetota bacterium]
MFGGMLGSTFNYVFETQVERLQNGDRFYYLQRTAGMEFAFALEAFARQHNLGRCVSNDTFLTVRCPLEKYADTSGTNLPVLTAAGASLYTFYAKVNYTYRAEARAAVIMQGPQTAADTGTAAGTTSPATTASW